MSACALRLVVNTSPLIHLAEAGLMHLLRDAASTVWVPEPVAREIRAYGDQDPTARALAVHDWLEVRPTPTVSAQCLAWDLGPGETAVLELARAFPGSTAVIDDLAGRRCAEALGLSLRGTVGLVLAAKQAGRLAAARPILEQLRDSGMYLSDAVLQRALRWVGGRYAQRFRHLYETRCRPVSATVLSGGTPGYPEPPPLTRRFNCADSSWNRSMKRRWKRCRYFSRR